MKIVDQITLEELKIMAQRSFDHMIKAVVDVERAILVVDAEMHADQEAFLLKEGSEQENLWGISLHPFENEENLIELSATINFRPSYGNSSRSVDDVQTQKKIINFVKQKVVR